MLAKLNTFALVGMRRPRQPSTTRTSWLWPSSVVVTVPLIVSDSRAAETRSSKVVKRRVNSKLPAITCGSQPAHAGGARCNWRPFDVDR